MRLSLQAFHCVCSCQCRHFIESTKYMATCIHKPRPTCTNTHGQHLRCTMLQRASRPILRAKFKIRTQTKSVRLMRNIHSPCWSLTTHQPAATHVALARNSKDMPCLHTTRVTPSHATHTGAVHYTISVHRPASPLTCTGHSGNCILAQAHKASV